MWWRRKTSPDDTVEFDPFAPTATTHPVERDDTPLPDCGPSVYPHVDVDGDLEGEGDEEQETGDHQFTVGELLGLVAVVAVVLGVMGCLPGGHSMEILAGVAGITVLASLVLLALLQPSRPIFQIAWWTLLGLYALASLAAVVQNSFGDQAFP